MKLFASKSNEEIVLTNVNFHGSWYLGKIAFLKCRGTTLVLFHELELMANDNIITETERLSSEINRLGFVAEGVEVNGLCKSLQVMNGDDIAFKI